LAVQSTARTHYIRVRAGKCRATASGSSDLRVAKVRLAPTTAGVGRNHHWPETRPRRPGSGSRGRGYCAA
jgi:hypothetical protein